MLDSRRRTAGHERAGPSAGAGAPREGDTDRLHHGARRQIAPSAADRRGRGGLLVQTIQRHGPARCRRNRPRFEGRVTSVLPENVTRTASMVFVVDDDVSVRESLELLIKSAGWQPETFSSAQDFLSRPRSTVPSCLVLDVTLPGLNGLELQQRLAERTDMPIIFITGYGDIPMSVRAMKAGAIEFLTKPFSDAALLN